MFSGQALYLACLLCFWLCNVSIKNLETYEEELSDLIAVYMASEEQACQAFQVLDDIPWFQTYFTETQLQ